MRPANVSPDAPQRRAAGHHERECVRMVCEINPRNLACKRAVLLTELLLGFNGVNGRSPTESSPEAGDYT